MNKRRPIVLFLCSVIVAAISVIGCASFTPLKNGNPTPLWQLITFYCSLSLLAASIISAIPSLIWVVVAMIRKPNSDTTMKGHLLRPYGSRWIDHRVLIGAFSLGVVIAISVLLALPSNVTEGDAIRLVDDIYHENRDVRDKARAEMRRLGPDAVPHLRKILFPTLGDKIRRVFGLQPRRSTPPSRKINAIRSCEFVGESAVPILLAFTTNRDANIRVVAVGTLSVVRGEHRKVVPALVEYLSDSEGLVRYFAIHGLIQYGSNAAMALPSLRRLTNDADPSVRRAASTALDRIRN